MSGLKTKIPKMIVVDLDGTLLKTDGSISSRTLGTLNKCRDKGILLVIATARFWMKAEKYIELIQPDYAILADGTQIYKNGEMIYGSTLTEMQTQGIVNNLFEENADISMLVCSEKAVYCSTKGINEPWKKYADKESMIQKPAYKMQ